MTVSESVEERGLRLLSEAEDNAWRTLAQGKFSLFGYWAAKVVQFRELLGKSHEPGPFHALVEQARNHTLTSREKP